MTVAREPQPVSVSAPFRGNSRETRLMAALEYIVHYAPEFALPNCRDEGENAEVSRAVAWLAAKYGAA